MALSDKELISRNQPRVLTALHSMRRLLGAPIVRQRPFYQSRAVALSDSSLCPYCSRSARQHERRAKKGFEGPMQLSLILDMLLLLAIANGAPLLAKKTLGEAFSYPLDCGRTLPDGQPLFGSSKTVRGILIAIIATGLCAPLFSVPWQTGLLIGAASMAGDLLSSFVKRRAGLAPSSAAYGLDQIPEALIPSLAVMHALSLTLLDVMTIVILFTVGSLFVSRLLFRIGLRDEPH